MNVDIEIPATIGKILATQTYYFLLIYAKMEELLK